MGRRRKRSSSRAGLWILLLVLVAAAAGSIWWLRQKQSSDSGCPSLGGQAVAQSKSARFTTVEELRQGRPGGVVRVQARLLRYRLEGADYQLQLGSLVQPGVSLVALMPPGRCMANREDAALLDELRQDFSLRFGPPTEEAARPSQPTEVVATGVPVTTAGGIELRPVLDLHVQ